jgi:hypothetical protein
METHQRVEYVSYVEKVNPCFTSCHREMILLWMASAIDPRSIQVTKSWSFLVKNNLVSVGLKDNAQHKFILYQRQVQTTSLQRRRT